MLAELGREARWGDFAEDTPAGLCYTSGTTGSPKGVLYTHRSNYLHTLRALQADAIALTASDCVLVAVPMFHANGWGLPFAAPAVGAKLVLPGRQSDGAHLAALIRNEGVTVAAGVQTVWLGLLDYLDTTGGDVPTLERVIIGGSTCPDRADPADGKPASGACANELGHDRAFAAGHYRAGARGCSAPSVRAHRLWDST